ncbi:hypothetical protein COBT_002658 [Conglomerata obtusa]
MDNIETITKQLNFYFSISNIRTDTFLRLELQRNGGMVRASTILTFNRMKQLLANFESLRQAIKSVGGVELVEITSDETNENAKDTKEIIDADKPEIEHNVKRIKISADVKSNESNVNIEKGDFFIKKIVDDEYLSYINDPEIEKRCVIIKGLATEASMAEIETYLKGFFTFVAIRMRRDAKKIFKGSVFVELPSLEAVEEVLKMKVPVMNETKKVVVEIELADEKKANEKSCDEKSCDQKSCDQKSCDQKSSEEKSCDKISADQKSCDQKTCDKKSCDQKSCDEKSCVKKSCDEKSCDKISANKISADKISADISTDINNQAIPNYLVIRRKTEYFDEKKNIKINRKNQKAEETKAQICNELKGKFYSYKINDENVDIKTIKKIIEGLGFVDIKNKILRFKKEQNFEEKEFILEEIKINLKKLNEEEEKENFERINFKSVVGKNNRGKKFIKRI